MITATSRYADDSVVTLTGPDGNLRAVITLNEPSTDTFNYISYQLQQGDRPDLLAYNFYGDATLWWKIADANPEIMDWWDTAFLTQTNTIIRIPIVTTANVG